MKSVILSTLALYTSAVLLLSATSSYAEEIKVFAGPGVEWSADCKRCEQQGSNVKISVEPEDEIIFLQRDPNSQHGVFAAPAELAKIALRGEDDSPAKIAIELAAPSMIGRMEFQKIPAKLPVELTRIRIKENFSGSLTLLCNVHFTTMQVILERN